MHRKVEEGEEDNLHHPRHHPRRVNLREDSPRKVCLPKANRHRARIFSAMELIFRKMALTSREMVQTTKRMDRITSVALHLVGSK